LHTQTPGHKYVEFPDECLQNIGERSESLEKFLMDTFHLLVSSRGAINSELARKLPQRTQRLTELAFLYVPLSFVTGVFGMNVKEINDSRLPIWFFFVVLAITAASNACIFAVLTRREKARPKHMKTLKYDAGKGIKQGSGCVDSLMFLIM
jgi:hypothetical protein